MTRAVPWDDWVYARSIQNFASHNHLAVHQLSTATGVFEIVWSGVFAKLFGFNFGILRLSEVVLTCIGGWALYALCLELEISRRRAAACSALYLFNPLVFVLSFSSMTDAPFTALLVVATYLLVKGFHRPIPDKRWLLAGSIVSAFAFLQRQPGALIPVGALTYLVIGRRFRGWKDLVLLASALLLIPILAGIAYVGWQKVSAGGIPYWQRVSIRDAFTRKYAAVGWRDLLLAFFYVGLSIVPIAVAAALSIPRMAGSLSRRATWFWIGGTLVLLAASLLYWRNGARMPYESASWFTAGGLGPLDLVLTRAPILSRAVQLVLTVGSALGAQFFVLCFAGRFAKSTSAAARAAALVLAILAWQFIAMVAAGARFGVAFDRYMVPLFPLALCFAMYCLNGRRLIMPILVIGLLVMASFSVVETRNFLVFEGTAWNAGFGLERAGISTLSIDAGAGWGGWHTYDQARRQGLHRAANLPYDVWWIKDWDLPIDETYVVANGQIPGYDVLSKIPYSQWLHGKKYVYVLRRST